MLCTVPKSALMKLTRVWKNLGFNQEGGGDCFNIFLERKIFQRKEYHPKNAAALSRILSK